jgi:type VI secretion system secreted protein VgrG
MSAILDNIFEAVAGLVEGSPLQANRLLRATLAGAPGLTAEEFKGFEAIGSGGFRFELGVLSPDSTLDPASLFGQNALVQLLTADSLTDLRPFHGLVTLAERVGANAGLARYRLVLEPWLALLKQQSDSRIWQGASVVDIAECLFAAVPGASWRWALADRSLYPQYRATPRLPGWASTPW